MERNFTKDYIECADAFRKSKASGKSVEQLYDLLYDLENAARKQNDDLTLSNLYSLLGYHQSAYEMFQSAADPGDRKNASRLYVLKEKAITHKNSFAIKDARKTQQKKECTRLSPGDFSLPTGTDNAFTLNKNVVIFNKELKQGSIEIFIYGNHKFQDYTSKITDYIFWLGNCKNELIAFYNREMLAYSDEKADDDWYNTLEIYSTRIIVGQNGNLYAEISGGDKFSLDHILDIEMENKTVIAISYDG